jgi:hypothetical protein
VHSLVELRSTKIEILEEVYFIMNAFQINSATGD